MHTTVQVMCWFLFCSFSSFINLEQFLLLATHRFYSKSLHMFLGRFFQLWRIAFRTRLLFLFCVVNSRIGCGCECFWISFNIKYNSDVDLSPLHKSSSFLPIFHQTRAYDVNAIIYRTTNWERRAPEQQNKWNKHSQFSTVRLNSLTISYEYISSQLAVVIVDVTVCPLYVRRSFILPIYGCLGVYFVLFHASLCLLFDF